MRFADRARQQCPPYAEMALALAAEFRAVDVHAAERELDRLADLVPPVAEEALGDQLGEVAAAVAGQIAPPRRRARDDDDLMLDAVLAERRGQPVMLTVIGAEIAARNRLRLGIVSDGRRHMLAHLDAEEPLVADFVAGRMREPGELRAGLAWHCSHQVAAAILTAVKQRAVERGDLARAMHAAELQLALPLDEHARSARLDAGALRPRQTLR